MFGGQHVPYDPKDLGASDLFLSFVELLYGVHE
jgi:hypothetical protein